MISNKNSKKRNYTDNSLDSYNLVMSIRQGTNWGSKRILDYIITKGFCTSLGSIEGWIYGGKKPFSIKNVNQIKESSKNLTSEKAYILGTLCGDGYISTGYRLGLKVADKDFAEYFKGCLERIYGAPCSISERIIKKMRYVGETGQGIEVLKDEQYGFKIRVCDYRVLVDIVNNPNTIIVRYVDKRGRIYKRLFLNF